MAENTKIEWTDATSVETCGVAGFPGYRVGKDGSVWSCWKHNGHQPRVLSDQWRRLKALPDGDGYLRVNLFVDGKRQPRKVHHLVLEAFVGSRPAGLEGRHDDGNPANGTLGNLRWDTPSANQRDRRRHGTSPRGSGSGTAKLTPGKVQQIRAELRDGAQQKDVAVRHGVAASTVSGIAAGRLWGWLAEGGSQ